MIEPEGEFGKDSITVRLIHQIMEMSYEQQLELLKQLEEMPTAALEISDRDEKRKPFKTKVVFSIQGVDYTGVSGDISASGMFIETDNTEFAVGQTLVLTILFTNRKKQAKIPAEIANIRENGIGIRFMKKSDD